MKFTGKGLVFNPKTKKVFVNFNKVDVYETSNEDEIALLELAGCEGTGVKEASTDEEPKENEPTKKELVATAKEAGIKGADRMSKDEIIAALRGE